MSAVKYPSATRGGIDGVATDQTEKLLYLIKKRGDQRPIHPDNRTRVVDPDRDFRSDLRVSNQSDLAQALGVADAKVSRWISRNRPEAARPMDPLARERISRIYRVPLSSLMSLPIAQFIEECQGKSVDWHALVAASPSEYIDVEMGDEELVLKYAVLGSEGTTPLATVYAELPFYVRFSSPKNLAGECRWAGWHLLMFNHDREQSGFKCYLPRYADHEAFRISSFPFKGPSLLLPGRPVLFHPERDIGKEFDMVIVAAQDCIPKQIHLSLIRDAQGPGIETALYELAKWLDYPLKQNIAVVARATYRVLRVPAS